MRKNPVDLRRRLYIQFRGEEGLDYGGVARYVLFLVKIAHFGHEFLQKLNEKLTFLKGQVFIHFKIKCAVYHFQIVFSIVSKIFCDFFVFCGKTIYLL